jgi:hypothetical protein
MKVLCLFAGPGSGKSTSAAGLFFKMKLKGYKCELVTEFAKDLTYDKRQEALSNQFYVLAKQEARLRRLSGQVDYAITDSPLPLGLLYVKPPYDTKWYRDACVNLFNSYDNVNYFIERVKPYAAYGRSQSEDQARGLDQKIKDIMALNDLPIRKSVPGDQFAPETILADMEKMIG